MKKNIFLLLPVLLSLSVIQFSCREKTAAAKTDPQKTDIPKEYLITEKGLGDLHIGMKVNETEKLLGKKFTLSHMHEPQGSWLDTAQVTYNQVPMDLYFERQYSREDQFEMVLSGIRFTHEKCKTEKGIGVGSHRDDIINAYDGYSMSIFYDFEDTTYTTRSKTRSFVNVSRDDAETMFIFTLQNKKVDAVELSRNYPGD